MDDLFEEFVNDDKLRPGSRSRPPACQINCGGQGDIAVNIQHHHPPKIKHEESESASIPRSSPSAP